MKNKKNDKWKLIFEKRLYQIIQDLEYIGNLSNHNYEYEEKWIKSFYDIQLSNVNKIFNAFKSKGLEYEELELLQPETSEEYTKKKSKFVFIFNRRVVKLYKSLSNLLPLASSENYEYSNDDVEYYINYIKSIIYYEYMKYKPFDSEKPVFKSLIQ